MAKDYTVTRLENINVIIYINAQNSETGKYHIATVLVDGVAKNGILEFRVARPYNYLGTGANDPFNNNEIYQAVKNYDMMNTMLANELKQLYIDAINVDPA